MGKILNLAESYCCVFSHTKLAAYFPLFSFRLFSGRPNKKNKRKKREQNATNQHKYSHKICPYINLLYNRNQRRILLEETIFHILPTLKKKKIQRIEILFLPDDNKMKSLVESNHASRGGEQGKIG